MDWGPVITAGITGIVGLAGIGGTLVSAKITRKSAAENLRTSIGAEDERARLAEKRRIYAQALASLTAVNVMGKEERSRITLAATSAVNEVVLIAPSHVWELAIEAENQARSGERGFRATFADLVIAMRDDLANPGD